MLKIEQLKAGYGPINILDQISFQIATGEIVALLGPNGAGKTTLLLGIMGFLQNIQGNIRFQSRDILQMNTENIVEQGIAMVPEDRGLFPSLTVMENLLLGAYVRLKKSAGKKRRLEIEQDLEEVFQLFPILENRVKQAVGTMSGGQQQMVAVARALMSRPKLLLLDEPSLGLAPLVIQEIFKAISVLNQKGVTVLLVEQNANLALKIAHRGYVMENGRIRVSGTSVELLNDPEVKQAYLGRD